MINLDMGHDELAGRLLKLSEDEPFFLLDSCGGSAKGRFLIAGMRPLFTRVIDGAPEESLRTFEEAIREAPAAIFTLSYEFGAALQGIEPTETGLREPSVFVAGFESLIIHDRVSQRSFIEGEGNRAGQLSGLISGADRYSTAEAFETSASSVSSSIGRDEYLGKVEAIRELIRDGETYQTNLTQQIRVQMDPRETARGIYARLRRDHPAAYSAYIDRGEDQVVSISPEQFLKVSGLSSDSFKPSDPGRIECSPIKGTRRRTGIPEEDRKALEDLTGSEKDRAENTMIVDLVRNDLGRVCRFGSVSVPELCRPETHPSLFHLVSTVEGLLTPGTTFSDVIRAAFPCGSITGCPKIRTMEIIRDLEPFERGLSMGAIGYAFDASSFPTLAAGFDNVPGSIVEGLCSEMSVAIRTAVVRDGETVFNVGGGIVIDSDPESEYEESIDKARAILRALGAKDTLSVL